MWKFKKYSALSDFMFESLKTFTFYIVDYVDWDVDYVDYDVDYVDWDVDS